MLSNLLEDWARGIARQVGKFVAKSGLTPNSLTILGFLLNFPAAFILAQGQNWSWIAGGLMILFAGVFDMLDGAVAKVTGKVTKFGAFLDSTLDRYSEVVMFLGLILYFRSGPNTDQYGGSILVYVAIAGSLMVSYAKARAEGLNMECKGVGLLPRPERVILVALGCLIQPFWNLGLIVILWILAIFTNFTAIQRIWHIWMTAKVKEPEAFVPQVAPTAPVTPVVQASANGHKEPAKVELEEEEPRKRWSFRRVDGR
ncbi:MAG TPA: CDP-alcohol phosphatidyltransferase family protein [Chloroflexia bacterium]|nr:CDP-alcohol phosphatidyltransferase family protein [Chloroflexia bacterium]